MFDLARLTAVTQNYQTSNTTGSDYPRVSLDKKARDVHASLYREDGHSSTLKKDQQPAEKAFDRLVLQKSHKNIVVSLVAQHYRDKKSREDTNEQVDIVRGKGRHIL